MTDRDAERDAPRILSEIAEQPAIVRRVDARSGDAARALGRDLAARSGRLHLVGCGDMHFAASLATALAPAGAPVSAWRSMEMRWARDRLVAADAVVCASVSGRTPRTLEAASLARDAGARVVALTDNPGSPIDVAVDETLILGTAPPEALAQDAVYAGYRSTLPQTATFTAVLALELEIAAALGGAGDRAEPFADALEAALSVGEAIEAAAPPFLAGGRDVVILGSGPLHPVARYGAAKMTEYAVPALAQCLEEWNHLEAFVAGEATRVVVLALDGPSADRAAELTGPWEELGVRSLVFVRPGAGPFGGDHTRIVELAGRDDPIEVAAGAIVALQLLAAHGVATLGADPDRWLGGRRPDLLLSISNRTIRGSRLWRPRP